MYIMYKPPGGGSIWVPLKAVSWSFVFCAVPNANKTTWVIKDDGSQGGTWDVTTSHPDRAGASKSGRKGRHVNMLHAVAADESAGSRLSRGRSLGRFDPWKAPNGTFSKG
jgi:hypothetical protein